MKKIKVYNNTGLLLNIKKEYKGNHYSVIIEVGKDMVDHWPVSTVLSEDEQKMIADYRKEKDMLVNEQNEKSPNQRAVEDIAALSAYLKANNITYAGDPINNAMRCMETRLGLIKDVTDELNQRNATGIVDLEVAVNSLVFHSHKAAVDGGWWNDPVTGNDLHGKRNIGELLMLIVSEIAEGMEGHRKDKMDDKLPHHKMLTVELVDALFRIGDLAGSEELPVGKAAKEKREYNLSREDHKHEQRIKAGGKRF